MKELRCILAVVDPTTLEQPGVAKAALLASRVDARLQLFACDTTTSRETRLLASRSDTNIPAELEPLLESLARPLRDDGLDIVIECAFARHLHEALLQHAHANHCDLIVKDTHHHSLAQRTFFTNTDWQLMRECPAPLLLVKEHAWSATPIILAALDPAHVNDKPATLDHEILSWSTAMRSCLHGTVHAAHAYIPLAIASATAGTLPPIATLTPEMIAIEDARERESLLMLVQGYPVDDAHIHVEFGSATEIIPRLARDLPAELVIMGAVSRNSVQRLFIGHTAERVLERLTADILVVKPPSISALPF